MKINPLERKEDQLFTQRVVAFNNEEDERKKERLYAGIKDRTTLLIFLISKTQLLLSSDEATSILLECEKELDKIISSFKVANCTFNQYLYQTCRYRGRRILRKEVTKNTTEANLMKEEAIPYYTEDRYNDEVYELPILPSNPNDDVLTMTIKELFFYIVKTLDRSDYPVFSLQENLLRKHLEDRTERKYFLSLLLAVPDRGRDDKAQNYARVFQTDEGAFECFFQKRRELQERRNSAYAENERLANKHWRLMLNLKTSIEKEYNREVKAQLMDNFRTQAILHRKKLYDMAQSKKGLTHDEIGALLGYSRSTITSYISNARKMLKSVAELSSVSTGTFEVSSLDSALEDDSFQ